MRDVVLHDVLYKERRQIDTYDGIYKVQPVGVIYGETRRKERLNLPDYPMECEGGNGGKETHEDGKQQDKLLVADIFLAPLGSLKI